MARVELARGREGPLLSGHPWIFSRGIARVEGKPRAGEAVELFGTSGRPLGWGFYNPASGIRVRAFSSDPACRPSEEAVRARLSEALAYRRDFLGLEGRSEAFRLVHSEGDGLSGLTVDRFGPVLVVQIHAAAWQVRLGALLDALEEELAPAAILDASDARARQLEGLEEPLPAALRGTPPEDALLLRLGPQGPRLLVRPGAEQKTGLFLDQRENWGKLRARLAARAPGRLLDVCCHHGGFGLSALAAGWACTFLDSSETALEAARAAMEEGADASFCRADAFAELRRRADAGERFEALVLDPPKLARTARKAKKALGAYRELNQQALRLLVPGGLFLTFSCTGHVRWQDFERVVARAAAESGRRIRVLTRLSAGADHPFHPACPETVYLKGLMVHVL